MISFHQSSVDKCTVSTKLDARPTDGETLQKCILVYTFVNGLTKIREYIFDALYIPKMLLQCK
uniref:AlNc14C364G11039 protein n=1 Tax=Albugo laibachii Nc14 TaxID=890382 RepID=F0WXV2_9STRA|nr:AlNc14C364G11039 [Albugo laibachii Nc14]|eukprot:CCA26300.1 AlNc14C364G11039 [Albugo laibachii Nc14]